MIASSVVLAFAFLLYAKPNIRTAIVASVLVLGGLALIVGGIAATARGEREFHHHDHDKEHGEDNHVEGDEEHSAPALDAPVVIK
jgi:hypothetical protein